MHQDFLATLKMRYEKWQITVRLNEEVAVSLRIEMNCDGKDKLRRRET